MKANQVAIVLTGYQKEFCSPDGKLHALIKDMLGPCRIIENTLNLLKRAKEKKIPVFNAAPRLSGTRKPCGNSEEHQGDESVSQGQRLELN